jgi:kynurenine formamidase
MMTIALAAAVAQFQVIDLTHPISPTIPTFGGQPGFSAHDVAGAGASYTDRDLQVNEHTGTHVDAPAHFIKGKPTVDAIPASSLVAPAVVIDVRDKVDKDPEYRIEAADLVAWERKHGKIPYGALIVAVTGWSRHWPYPKRYRGVDAAGGLHFPGFGEDAVDWLIANRPRVVGLAIDTLSVDYGRSVGFEVHKKSHGAGLYHVENLDRPERLPAKGATIVVGVIPFDHGSGAPARVIALVATGASGK